MIHTTGFSQAGAPPAAAAPCAITCIQMNATVVTLHPYTAYLAGLLGGAVTRQTWPAAPTAVLAQQLAALPPADLLVVGEPERQRRGARRLVRQAPASLLLARQPRWPLERILLVVRADGRDDTAVSWAGRLAHASGAHLTLLAAVPSLPPLLAAHQRQAGLDALLTPTTTAGGQLRRLADLVLDAGAEGTLHLRQGEPDWQLRWEVDEGNPDLVVIAAPAAGWRSRLADDPLWPLLRWIARPVLVALPLSPPQPIQERKDRNESQRYAEN